MRPFSGLAPSELKIFSKKFYGSICAYRVFNLPIFREIEGGGGNPSPGPYGTEKSVVLRGRERYSEISRIYVNIKINSYAMTE